MQYKRYPYPKIVWSPSGGWWVQPSNWVSNTAATFAGILAVTGWVWYISAKNEVRTIKPKRPIPSMLWAKEFK
ncbi:hypothetical protein BDQ17DRAFT_1272412 [Cyathus striatus]|nr:hypothetical protein BDQ17DRAFT_1272412 [Cyathus striatus]